MSAATVLALMGTLFEQGMKAYALYKTLHADNRTATADEMKALFADGHAALADAEAEVARRGG